MTEEKQLYHDKLFSSLASSVRFASSVLDRQDEFVRCNTQCWRVEQTVYFPWFVMMHNRPMFASFGFISEVSIYALFGKQSSSIFKYFVLLVKFLLYIGTNPATRNSEQGVLTHIDRSINYVEKLFVCFLLYLLRLLI